MFSPKIAAAVLDVAYGTVSAGERLRATIVVLRARGLFDSANYLSEMQHQFECGHVPEDARWLRGIRRQ